MLINLKTLTGDKLLLEVMPTDRVGDMKQRIEQIYNIPEYTQRLIFRGKALNDDSAPIISYGLTDGCIVHLLLRISNNSNFQIVPQPVQSSCCTIV